jgi:thiol:disulfide interchange protein DsbD
MAGRAMTKRMNVPRPSPGSSGARRIVLQAVLALLLPTGAPAQELLDPNDAFRFSARALDPATIEVSYRVAPGYYLYRKNFKFELAEPRGAALGEPQFPPGHMKNDPIFGETEIYRDEVKIRLTVRLPQGTGKVSLLATSQGCSDVGVCYVPQQQKLTVAMTGSEKSRPSLPSFLRRP